MPPAEPPILLRPERGPDTLKVTRWGGRRLAALRGGPDEQGRTVGESWEFSTLPGSESAALGRPLGALLGGPLPFLAKLIDTALPLSVQVHPHDRPAPDHSMLPGKEEAWLILAADPGARLWAGLQPGLSRDELARAACAGAPILGCLREHVAEPGMCVLVPAGTVHAIGGGLLLAEIQQPSDCTYRLYDYGSGRPLHVDEALAAADLAAQPQVWRPSQPPSRLVGEHVSVELLGPGEHRCAPDTASFLLIGARERAHVLAGREREPLGPGDLLLARGPVTVEVPPGGLAALGSVR